MINGLFSFRIVDVVDILLFAVLLWELYNLVKGTAAIRIFIGMIAVYLIWKVVRAFHMTLLTEILGQFTSVGVIALIVVFTPEIRQFLLLIGKTRIIKSGNRKGIFWRLKIANTIDFHTDEIVKACQKMAETRTGALIVIARQNELQTFVETGQKLDAGITEALLETIFFKNSPLHDGAVIINRDRITAARCILPVSNRSDIPKGYGLRHRSAVGITERSDSIAIIVSEERGQISVCLDGKLTSNISPSDLSKMMERLLKA